jgi:hypothetical protein
VNAKQRSWQVAWILSIGLSVALAWTAAASDMGMAAADQVSLSSIQGFLNYSLYTHTGHSRGPNGAQHDLARDNIKTIFESYGLSVVFDTFTYSGSTYENVVATKLGTVYPNQEYIIGGHYDSVNNPGADDNASGVALVLEAARIITQYDSDYTIRFIAFDMEEQGLIGSTHYADTHYNDDILGMISADMVAYDPATNKARIYGRTASNPIKNAVASAVAEYGQGLSATLYGQLDASDHAPFEAEGFQACLLIEGEVWNNPYYHTQQDCYDTPNYLNFTYAVKMTRSIVGWLVDTADVNVPIDALGFSYPNGRPEYISPAGGTTIRVEVYGIGAEVPQPGTGMLHYNVGAGWQSVPMTMVAPNLYDAVMPAATCPGTVLYYFSAQAVGGQVYTDPRQAPTSTYSAMAAYGISVFYENTMDTNPGWTVQGLWAFGRPTGGGGEYGGPDPTSGHTGTNVYGYNLSGDYENNLPERHLTSTAIDCTGMSHVHLKFWRWLGVERSQYDHAYVRVSNNGTNWVTVWQNPDAELADTSWNEVDLDISAVADNRPAVYLRWTMGTTDGGWRYCGWNIDDLQLTSLNCEAPFLVGDLNCDGEVDFHDINPFVLALTDIAAYELMFPGCPFENRDINGDGEFNFADINPFVALLSNP